MNVAILETKRLILRPFNENDISAIYEIFSNQKINTYLPWFPLKNEEEAKAFYEERFAHTQDYKYAICLKENNVPIGYIHVSNEEHHDFGYGLLENYWRQGIVSEAGRALLTYVKEEGLPYVTATHDVHNFHSGYVMKALGMTYQYTYEEMWQPKNFLVHFRMYQLNFNESANVYKAYWNMYENHFIEENV